MVETAPSIRDLDLCRALDAIDKIAAAPETLQGHLADLFEATSHSNSYVRKAIAEILGVFPRYSDQTRDYLLVLAGDANDFVARAAITSLGQLRDPHPSSLDVLVRALQGPEALKRASAVALGNIASEFARKTLVDAALHGSEPWIWSGIQTAGLAIADDLRAAIDGARGTDKGRLISLLGTIDKLSRLEIIKFLTDDQQSPRSEVAALIAVDDVDPTIFTILRNILEEPSGNEPYHADLQLRVLDIFRRLGEGAANALPAIMLRWDCDDRTPWNTNSTLVAIGAPSVAYLTERLRDPSQEGHDGRLRALKLLPEIGESAQAALPEILGCLSAPTQDERYEACLAALQFGCEFAPLKDVLNQMIKEKHDYTCERCIKLVADKVGNRRDTPPEITAFVLKAARYNKSHHLRQAIGRLDS